METIHDVEQVTYLLTPRSDAKVEPRDEVLEIEIEGGKETIGLHVIHLILSITTTDEAWKYTSIFHTYKVSKQIMQDCYKQRNLYETYINVVSI